MKAWNLPKLSGVNSMTIQDVPDPVAGEGEVMMRVEYAALNPADRYLAEGQYPARPTFPHILGRDGVGVVESVGPGVSGVKVGDRRVLVRSEVGVNRHGTFAEKVAIPIESLVPMPDGWTLEQSAGATLVYLTAWMAITQWTDLPKKCVLLITGASGGVGVASTQLGSIMGHTVVALSRSKAKQKTLKEIGAAITLDPQDPTWPKKLKEQLPDGKVDLAIDSIGGPLFNDVLNTLNMNGRISCVGRLAGPVPNFNTAATFFRRAQIRGVSIATYTAAESRAAWEQIVALMNAHGARPLVDQIFPFDQLLAAFDRLQKGPMGKVLLKVS